MSTIFITEFPRYERPGFDAKNYFSNYMSSNVIVNASSKSVSYEPNPGGPLTIKYVFKGEEYYSSHECKYRVKSDRFMIFNEQQKYSSCIDSDETTESFSVFFRPSYVKEVLSLLVNTQDFILENPQYPEKSMQQVNFIERLYSTDNKIIPIITKMRAAIKQGFHSQEYYNEQLYFLLEGLLYLNRELYSEIEKVSSVKASTKLELYRRLNIARDYIESCYNEKITLALLAKAVSMCEHHLLREFKKFYGSTPYQYLTETRLCNAKRLLAETEKTISEISTLTGFEFMSSFSEVFSKRFGISPTSFRRSCI